MEQQPYINIAVADDHQLYRSHLCLFLAISGFHVLADVSNGEALIERLRTLAILPDACIVDMHMPVMDGIATINALKKEWSNIKIVAMSMDTNPMLIAAAIKAGADTFLEKGSDPEALGAVLNRICHPLKE